MEKTFDSLSTYISLAKKTINKFAPKFYNGLNKEMLNNEEAVWWVRKLESCVRFDWD